MKNMLAALFAACLAISIAAVVIVVASESSAKPHRRVTHDSAGDDVIDAAIARQLAAAKARVSALREHEAVAIR